MCKSSNYYRKNKETQSVVHVCPHCNYSTTGPKITLKHHILAKHTRECYRPFQCMHPGCERGFAQKIHLDRHLCKVHGKKIDKGRKKKVLYYLLSSGDKNPTSKKTKERMHFYENKKIVTPKMIRKSISMSNFQYDRHNNYIVAVPITENYIINNVITQG